MPVYAHKQWWDGDNKEDLGEPLPEDLQELYGQPLFRPGYTADYRPACGGQLRSKASYVWRAAPDRLDFYHMADGGITVACAMTRVHVETSQ